MRLIGIEQEQFVILPHPQVLGYMRKQDRELRSLDLGHGEDPGEDAGSLREVGQGPGGEEPPTGPREAQPGVPG